MPAKRDGQEVNRLVRLLRRPPEERTDEDIDAILEVTKGAFERFTDEQRKRLAAKVNLVALEEGQLVYKEGELCTGLAVVLGGKLCTQSSRPNKYQWPKSLRSGSLFGEEILLNTDARAPEVKAVRKSVIGFTGLTDVLHCLSTDGARELLDAPTLSLCRTLLQTPPGASATPNERSDETLGELVWATRCLGFFQQIHAPEAHAALMREAKLRTFAPGSVICSEGDKVDALFVIVRGCAAASACSARTPTRPSFVDMLTAGDAVGVCAASLNLAHTMTCVTHEGCECIELPRKSIGTHLRAVGESIKQKVTALQAIGPLQRWPINALARLSHYFVLKHYRKNEIVVRQSDPAVDLHLVKAGEFKVRKVLGLSAPRVGSRMGSRPGSAQLDVADGSTSARPRSAGPSRSSTSVGQQKNGQKVIDLNVVGEMGVFGDTDIFVAADGKCIATVICHSWSGSTLSISRRALFDHLDGESLEALQREAEMKHEFRMSRLAEAMASVSVGRRPSTAGLGRTSSFRAGLSLDQFQWGARAVLPDVGVSKSATLTLASEKRALGSIGARSVSEPLELAAEAGEKLGVSAGDGRGAADDAGKSAPAAASPASASASPTQGTRPCSHSSDAYSAEETVAHGAADGDALLGSDADDDYDYFGTDSEDEEQRDELARTLPLSASPPDGPKQFDEARLTLSVHPRTHYVRPTSVSVVSVAGDLE